MSLMDIARMAIHNLWSRRARTALNLTGIVVGCIVLLMTAAGGAGVKNAIHLLFDSSEFARQIYLMPRRVQKKDPPPGAVVVKGEMSDERRERIKKKLEQVWRRENTDRQKRIRELTPDLMDQIRQLEHVQEVLPEIHVLTAISMNDEPEIAANLTGTRLARREDAEQILAGRVLTDVDRDGILLDEFCAYQLGYESDAELKDLVGRTVAIQYRIGRDEVASIYSMLTNSWQDHTQEKLRNQIAFLQTLGQLMNDLDKTTLSDEQKKTIRSLMNPAGTGETSDTDPDAADTAAPGDSKVNNKASAEKIGSGMVTREFVVRGIFHQDEDKENPAARLFRSWFHNRQNRVPLRVHPGVAEAVFLSLPGNTSFYNATVVIQSAQHLESVTQAIEELDIQCESSLWIIKNIDSQIDRNTWVIYGIATAVLLTAAVGIFNTLTMSVLERTPEFGIMKSLGARDGDLVRLMLVEGALLGLVGATIAIVMSRILGLIGKGLLKMYVESQTQSELAGDLFQFGMWPAVIVILLAIVICVCASILPAFRAARLDPIVAMRRR